MKLLSGYLDDAYMTFLSSSVNCCVPLKEQAPMRGIEKPMRIEHHQPRLIPPPIPEPQERPSTRGREWATRTRSFASRASSRGSFSVRRKLNAYNGPRRPRIGAPTEFRHVENAMPRRKEMMFRPLELSIYMPDNQLSPILPHFGNVDDLYLPTDELKDLQRPPTALTHSRSESALSFRIPRKPVRSNSGTSSEWTANFRPRPNSLSAQELLAALEHQLPKAPPPARLRSMTEPPAYERVKSALHEKFELEQRLRDIDIIIEERKSIYLSSRPTSRVGNGPPSIYEESIYEESQEPMPLPPMKPTFAERVTRPHADQRPKTAPSKTVHIPTRHKSFTEASAAFTSHPPFLNQRSERSTPPPPPLPLVLQTPHPPLRKKKSFSRVSNWLFPSTDQSHSRNISLDTVTNTPKPVTSREGFYQCIELKQQATVSTTSVSTVSTLESELDEPTVPTTWTPDSSPGGVRREVAIRSLSLEEEREMERKEESLELTRVRTFGEREIGPDKRWRMEPMPVQEHVTGRNSVGVAF